MSTPISTGMMMTASIKGLKIQKKAIKEEMKEEMKSELCLPSDLVILKNNESQDEIPSKKIKLEDQYNNLNAKRRRNRQINSDDSDVDEAEKKDIIKKDNEINTKGNENITQQNNNENAIVKKRVENNSEKPENEDENSETGNEWWVPTDDDTNEAYQKWYESAYRAALKTAQEKSCGTNGNFGKSKRKVFEVDPKTETERVSLAQKELTKMMQPLHCKLCNATMNTTNMAQNHYKGKPHQKKVTHFLQEKAKKYIYEEVQVSSSTTATSNTNTSSSCVVKDLEPELQCQICNAWFTSKLAAEQHYQGKKHKRAAFGVPFKHASKQKSEKNPIDATGRYGIGLAFMKIEETEKKTEKITEEVVLPPSNNVEILSAEPLSLRCDICDISVTRPDILEIHKKGAKHQKKLKNLGIKGNEISEIKRVDGPYAKFRTPAGHYYCSLCSISVNSEISFESHIQSKRHKHKENIQSQLMQKPSANDGSEG